MDSSLNNLIQQEFEVDYQTSGVYKLLYRMGFSHQKAHRDYANASKQEQRAFIDTLKKLLTLQDKQRLLFYDEFSISEQNSTYYSWAKPNSRPMVKSNESTRKRVNGLLSIDVLTGKQYLWLTSHAQSDDVAHYMAHLAVDMAKEGVEQVEILRDCKLNCVR